MFVCRAVGRPGGRRCAAAAAGKMAASSLEQKLSRLEAKLKQENREARRRIDLNLDISPQRPRPSKHGGVGEGAGGGGARSAGGPAHVSRPRLLCQSALASPHCLRQLSARVERVTVTPRLGAGGLPDGPPPAWGNAPLWSLRG